MLKIEQFTDVCMTGGIMDTNVCRFTKVKVFFLVLVDVFSFS